MLIMELALVVIHMVVKGLVIGQSLMVISKLLQKYLPLLCIMRFVVVYT